MRIVIDECHGQQNWGQTGFPTRGVAGAFRGVGRELRTMGADVISEFDTLRGRTLEVASGLVIPPPVGLFDGFTSSWLETSASLFTEAEIHEVVSFVAAGGSLLAVSYRFGDAFTKANLGSLSREFGWRQNNDAVIDVELAGALHPLQTAFRTTPADCSTRWAGEDVTTIHWRPVTTFTPLPDCDGTSVVLSPTGTAAFDFTDFRIHHGRRPICVAGQLGKGRYCYLGGPHAIETDGHGFLEEPGNTAFLRNLLRWLFSNTSAAEMEPIARPEQEVTGQSEEVRIRRAALWQRIDMGSTNSEKAEVLVEFTAQVFEDTGILTRIATSQWSSDRESEVDLVFECSSSKPLWVPSRGIVPVECKNWSDPVGATEITRFAEKVGRTSGRLGFFVARRFTSAARSAVMKARLQHGTLVGMLDDTDLVACVRGQASPTTIIEASLVRSALM
jgi:hypothetical protein